MNSDMPVESFLLKLSTVYFLIIDLWYENWVNKFDFLIFDHFISHLFHTLQLFSLTSDFISEVYHLLLSFQLYEFLQDLVFILSEVSHFLLIDYWLYYLIIWSSFLTIQIWNDSHIFIHLHEHSYHMKIQKYLWFFFFQEIHSHVYSLSRLRFAINNLLEFTWVRLLTF